MILLDDYLMKRDKDYPLTGELLRNACDLLVKVNLLLIKLNFEGKVSSGYRPGHYNERARGSKNSGHLTCKAIDISDKDGLLAKLITDNPKLLERFDLYLEDPSYCDGWVHLDTRKRLKRIFRPY